MKICTYSIALNEAKHVQRWLNATKDSDYRVVADTGSIDGTAELLEAAGVTVHRIVVKPWRFDTARNTALALLPTDADVCFSLDMDEVPEKNFYKKVRRQWVDGCHKAYVKMNTGSAWNADRLHTRFGWRWVSPCHEVTEWYGEGQHQFCEIDAHISHQPDDTKSRGQYLPLLEMAVKETPHDPRMWVYLCREYYYAGMWMRCVETARKALDCKPWGPEAAAVCRWAGHSSKNLGHDPGIATGWYRNGVQFVNDEQEPWFGIAIDAYHNQQWQACLDASLRILELPPTTHYLHDHNIGAWQAYDLASVSLWNLGDPQTALTFAREAAKADSPERDRLVRNLEFLEKACESAS